MVATLPSATREVTVDFHPRGGALELWQDHGREVLLVGPTGTGKTLPSLWKLHLAALKYPGMQGLMLRKTARSLTSSALVTYQRFVLNAHPDRWGIDPFGGSQLRPPGFRYPNGSELSIGGIDIADKLKSTEYDLIYVNEATDLDVDDWEMLLTRRHRSPAMPYTQLFGDCNPGAPSHWLYKRIHDGKVHEIHSRFEDNPVLFDWRRDSWTKSGESYIAGLRDLTGVRRLRLYEGRWAAAEGQVYEEWDAAVHLVEPFVVPAEWPRYVLVDFGYTNPFVCQWWAQDGDGRLYRYREVYMTGRLVEEHSAHILALHGKEPKPRQVITDHDAEDRQTFEKHTGWKTSAAVKDVKAGIDAVKARLKKAGDGRPRIYLMRDARVELDQSLRDAGKPTCTEEEFDTYIWDTRPTALLKEHPVKENDHGMDCVRYLCRTLDGKPQPPKVAAVAMPHTSTWG